MKISREAEKEIRSFAMRHSNGYSYSAAPIIIENGNSKPRWEGSSSYYENKSGDRITYVNAYRKAWGKPIYVSSTRHIVVGRKWLSKLEIDLIQVKMSRKAKRLVSRELAKFIFNFGI